MSYILTIAIPTYNRMHFLKRAIDAILLQYDDRVEILVSDNCSEDDSYKLMDNYQSKYPFIQYIRNSSNIGADGNFLQCLKKANGKYVWLLGSDDVITEDSISFILGYIEKYDCPLFFMNHVFFQGTYQRLSNYNNSYIKSAYKCCLVNKKDFINTANKQISFMSSLLISKDAFERVSDPEKYIGTWFLHTCIALEVAASREHLGIIYYPCVADDTTPSNSGFSINPERSFHVFGERMKYVFCTIGEKCGFDINQMKNVHKKAVLDMWPFYILNMKAKLGTRVKKAFWDYGYESVKEYKEIWFTIIPILYIPQFIAKPIVKYIKPIYKRIRS